MPHPLSAILARPGRAIAGLVGAGALLLLLGGIDARGDAADADPALRHAVARRAMDHLDGLKALASRLGEPAAPDGRLALDQDLKRARTVLGADMIALRELARPGDEEATLRGTLAALALYQAGWIDARARARSDDLDGARRTLAAAAPLGKRATAALASLGHIVDDTDAAAEKAYAAAERWHRIRNAGLALLAAGALLLWAGRPRNAGIEMNRA